MSIEGYLAEDVTENSGEIKIVSSDDSVFDSNDNSFNKLGSYIIMGVKQDIASESNAIGTSQVGIADQKTVTVNNDVQIEDWLLNKANLIGNIKSTSNEVGSDLNLVKNCNFHLHNSSSIINLPKDNVILPQFSHLSTCTIEDTNSAADFCWDDILILNEGLCSSTIESNNVLCPGISSDKLSHESDQPLLLPVAKSTEFNPVPSVWRKLPFVKISKDCLLKGKILGKSDVSLLSNNNAYSFLSLPPINNTELTNSQEVGPSILESLSSGEKIHQSFIFNTKDQNQPDAFVNANSLREGSQSLDLVHLQEREIRTDAGISMQENKLTEHTLEATPNVEACSININSFGKDKKVRKTGCLKKKSTSVPLAFVEISSNEADNTTEILIRTEDGENVYKGKTNDVKKSTSQLNNRVIDGMTVPEPNKSVKNYDEAAVNKLFVSLLGVTEEVLERYEGTLPLHCPVESCVYTNPKGSCLKLHILQHCGIRPFTCDFPGCTWAFYTSFRLKRHQNVHLKKREFKCPIEKCGRSFSTIYNLNTHSKLHERPFSVMCTIDECNRAFQTRKSYERHLRDHGIDHAPYKCEKCGNKYFTINSLNSHGRIHQHKIESLQCSYCGKMFDQPCRLKAHLNSHTGTKPFKCNVCSWAFTTSSKLRRHERKHSQNRKHVCKICGKTYLRAEHLKDHSHNHFVKKSFVCPEPDCNLVLSNKSSMYSHLKRHRAGTVRAMNAVNLTCPVLGCDILFDNKDNLQSHLQEEHVAASLVSESSEDAEHIMSEENLSTFEGLQNNNTSSSGPGFVSFNSTSQEGILVGMSDIVQCIPPMEQGDFSESNSSSNIITQVVFSDDIGDEENASEESQVLTEMEEEMGSARTGLVFQTLSDCKEDASATSLTPIPTTPRHTASDVVLSAASQDSLLQDELSEGDLYMGAEESLGELQVLLLDPATRMQHSDFEQSTINLRDLE